MILRGAAVDVRGDGISASKGFQLAARAEPIMPVTLTVGAEADGSVPSIDFTFRLVTRKKAYAG